MINKKKSNVSDSWKFFKPIITKKDGSISLIQLKKELSDFHFLLQQVPILYEHVTGGTLSKVNYPASVVIQCYNTNREREMKQLMDDFIDDLVNVELIKDKKTLTSLKKFAKSYI